MIRNAAWKVVLGAVALACAARPLGAQVSGVKIYAEPSGPLFYVDDQPFTQAVTLMWPAGSKHIIRTESTQSLVISNTQFVYAGAETNLGTPKSLNPITADPGITYVKLKFTKMLGVMLSYYKCASNDDTGCLSSSPGKVFINGEEFTHDGQRYFAANSQVSLEAYPNAGYIFTGWGMMPGVDVKNTFQFSFSLNQPQVIHPLFTTARPVQLSVTTLPPGMQLLIDRTPMTAPINLEWGWNTVHAVGVNPVQRDGTGHLMLFDSWSDGGAVDHAFTAPAPGSSLVTLSARFVPGAYVSFLTDPSGLKLTVDGRQNWTNYNFTWAAGSTHDVSAPAAQLDALGRKYKFVSWSNGAAAAQTVRVAAAPDDVRYMATFAPVAQISVGSVPSGVKVQVDGDDCVTPCAVEREVGVPVRVSAPAAVPVGDGSRMIFQGWTDNGSPQRDLISVIDPQALSANYQLQYRLAVSADPPEGVEWHVQPDSTDGYYAAQTSVTLTAVAQAGFRFLRWSGDLSGSGRAASVTMTSPKSVVALLDRVPFVPPGGVKNAAGDTPEGAVAPGSVVSIIGFSLAPGQEIGPASPLKQTLAGVTVWIGERLLPLFYVSPGQINAQLPADLPEGPQTLTVRWEGKPDVKVDFTVARNAPGLFTNLIGDTAYALAAHADGTEVTPDNAVRKGETITLFGTGLGPYVGQAPDGFALPEAPNFLLADAVDILAGDAVVQPVYAGAAVGRVGVNAVRFIAGNDLPAGVNVALKVRINGHESNTVTLPLQ
jgi:uncharacterized protein (TIGR03437 family)